MKRVLYIQYTNPCGYPPLEHSSRILADAGWDVLFLGTGASGADSLDFPPHPRVSVCRMPFQKPGWRQKLHYFRYCLWVFATAFQWRPHWIYASDPFSCPPALALTYLTQADVLYHEHDSPRSRSAEPVLGFILGCRRRLARRARMCVLPNAARLRWFEEELGPLLRRACVWNCPRRAEVSGRRDTFRSGICRVVYHGTIVPDRVPRTVVEALALLPDTVRLRVTGYETVGAAGYPQELKELAVSLGIGHRVEFRGPLSRWQLMQSNDDAQIGLALTPMKTADANFLGMTGASNKAFDYMAAGLALIVSDLPEWRETFVSPGFGLACNPSDAQSLAAAIGRLAANPAECFRMGEAGRVQIRDRWNYETQFQPVLDLLSKVEPDIQQPGRELATPEASVQS